MKKIQESLKLIPVIFALGYIPLIVHLHIYDSGFENYDWFPASEDGTMYDFFLFFKSAAVITTAAVMLCIMISDIIRKKKDLKSPIRNRSFAALSLYLFFVLLSGLFSPHLREAFTGAPEVFEGVPVIFGYAVFCAYSFLYVSDEKSLKTVLKGALPGVFLELIIGFFQVISRDLLALDMAKALMVPSDAAELRDSLTLKFAPGVAYGTLYNSNYVAQWAGFVFFISTALTLCRSLRKKYRVVSALSAALSLLMISKADSRSALAAFAAGFLMFILILITDTFKDRLPFFKPSIMIFAAAIILCTVLLITLRTGLLSIGSEPENRLIDDVRTGDDGVFITLNGKTLKLSYEVNGEEFYLNMEDEAGNEPQYELSEDGTRFCLSDEAYAGMEVFPAAVDNKLCMFVYVDDKELIFSDLKNDGGYLYLNNAGKFAKFHKYEKSTVFPDDLFTDRGFIWNYCLKMLPRYLFKGCGANTFVYAFPNDDDYQRLYENGDVTYFDVKAHSLCFQQAVENGLPAFICFMLFYVFCFMGSFKEGAKDPARIRDDLIRCVSLGILAGSICYMISGLANDSNVNTAPVFWILAGIKLYCSASRGNTEQ